MRLPAHLGGGTERLPVTGRFGVDNVVNDSSVHHNKRHDPKPDRDATSRIEPDAQFRKRRVQDAVDDGDEHDDSGRVEVLHYVVGNAVTGHLESLTDEVVAGAVPLS